MTERTDYSDEAVIRAVDKEVYGTAEGEGIVDFESLLTNSVIPNNPDSIFDIKHRKRADDAKVVEEAKSE